MKAPRKSKRNPSRSGSTAGVLRRLRQLAKRHAAAMGAINESVYDWNIAEDSVYFSGDMERVLGLPANALKSFKDWHERIHPDDFARYRDATVAHLKGATGRFECDYRYRVLDGTWHWARTHGLAIRDRQGRATRMIGSIGDITELKERERELAEQKAILQSTLEQQSATADVLKATLGSPHDVQQVFQAILTNASRLCEASFVGLFLYDGEYLRNVAHRSASAEFAQVLQGMRARPSRETTTRRCALERRTIHTADLLNDPEFPPPEAQRHENVRTALSVPMLREGALFGVITLWRAEVRPFSEKQIALVQTFADQAVIGIENVRLFNETKEALDRQTATAEVLRVISGSITDTQPVFDAIVRNCQRLFGGRAVALVMPKGAMLQSVAFASDGNVKGEQAPLKLWPLDRDSAGGACILDSRVIAVPDIAEVVHTYPRIEQLALELGYRSALFVPLMREGKAIACLTMLRAATGEFSDKEVSLARTFADQAVIAIENARLFSEIQDKSRQLEVASRHKSEFLASMSHELRTPLNAIIGFTRIVMRRSQEHIEPKQYENLEKILASGQHLLALINSILDLAKVEAGRVEVNPGEVGLSPVLESCVRTVEPLVKADAVTLVKEFDGALPQMYVDEEKLRQIVINLLSNAAKFTSHGSIRLQAHASNGSVAVAVCDTGIGIAPDKLDVIFEEFAQADASSTRVYGGTGLGLTIARRLARLMGGEIIAESVLGGGSRFTLTLPVRYAA